MEKKFVFCESCGRIINLKKNLYHELASLSRYFENQREIYCQECWEV